MTPVLPSTDLSDIEAVKPLAAAFAAHLKALKADTVPAGFAWYPYDTIANVWHLADTLTGANRALFENIRGQRIADIGAADGDMAFFCESLGASVDIIDNAPTNMNGLRGAEIVKRQRQSQVNIHDMDMDKYFTLPAKYDFVFFMGILYHLQNPYYVLSYLAKNVRRMILSNKIANHPPHIAALPEDASYDHIPLSYLLDSRECNNDPTNYWVFTDAGMRRILDRTGWNILDYRRTNVDGRTDPVTTEGDQRVYCYLESRVYEA